MAKDETTKAERDELARLRTENAALTDAVRRADDAFNSLQKSSDENLVRVRTQLETYQKIAADEAIRRVDAEQRSYASLAGHRLKHLVWLRDNVGDAIKMHDAFSSICRHVEEFVRREFNTEVFGTDSDDTLGAADGGALFAFVGDRSLDLVLPWALVDALELEHWRLANGTEFAPSGTNAADLPDAIAALHRQIEVIIVETLGGNAS